MAFLEKIMAQMTDEEADYWDEYFTKNPPKVDPSKKGGYFTQQRELLNILNEKSVDYIMSRSMSTNKMPAQIIDEMVQQQMTVSA
jgi:hypothetical protein